MKFVKSLLDIRTIPPIQENFLDLAMQNVLLALSKSLQPVVRSYL
jgi:hypothetical protein